MHWSAKKYKYHDRTDTSSQVKTSKGIWHQYMLAYICDCQGCGKAFYSDRPHAQTCSPKCRKAKSRESARQAQFNQKHGIQPESVTLPENTLAAETAQSVTLPEPKSAAERIRDALSLPCAYCQKLPRVNGWAICEPCHERSELNFWAYQAYKDTSQRFKHYFRVSN